MLLVSSAIWGQSEKPNIVFILADDLGWADLPIYGNKFNEAPNLTKLARDGMLFTNAYASSPVCSPTRASIMSGQYPARVAIISLLLVVFSRHVLDFRPSQPVASLGIGVAVFVIWILPDLLWAGYRDHWLFQNGITGTITSSIADHHRMDGWVLFFRSVLAILIVPVVEELFWRAWLMRWLIKPQFETLRLGTYSAMAFWVTALMFASEHGPYWDVGLLAGIIYNWWMVRTRSLADCILAHACTNACLSFYVIFAGKWEYWL